MSGYIKDIIRSTEPEFASRKVGSGVGITKELLRKVIMEKQQEYIIQFFNYTHLPERLQLISQPFCDLAHNIVNNLPRNPERTVALRKLLEAKDAAVRAVIAQ